MVRNASSGFVISNVGVGESGEIGSGKSGEDSLALSSLELDVENPVPPKGEI